MAFTTTTGANGVVSLVGTSGVDADLAIVYSSNVYIDAKEANDLIGLATQTGQTFVTGYTVIGGQGSDQISNATQATVGSTIWGDFIDGDTVGSGDDVITLGVTQNTTVLGLGGIDLITTKTTQGSDINGNEGADVLTIGSTFVSDTEVTSSTDIVTDSFIRGGKGADTINVDAALLLSNHINGNKDNDLINVTVYGTGLTTSTTVYGGQGSDVISVGGEGTSATGFVVFGDLGNDSISGSNRKDSIDGGEGDDKITGEQGVDKLTGGLGKDTFAQFAGDSAAQTATGTDAAARPTITFGKGIDVITDSTVDDTITYTAGLVTTTIKTGIVGLTSGTWDGANNVFTVNPFGSDYHYGDPTTTNSFIILGQIAAPAAV